MHMNLGEEDGLGVGGRSPATEIIEKRAEFSSSRGSHFPSWAKCNGPFVYISPGVDQSVVGTAAIIQMRLNSPPWVEDKDAGSHAHPED